MHGKNISMRFTCETEFPTRITPRPRRRPANPPRRQREMALAINRKFLHAAITVDDLIKAH
jgi:hypothetical protein